jgi:hypothetical protein
MLRLGHGRFPQIFFSSSLISHLIIRRNLVTVSVLQFIYVEINTHARNHVSRVETNRNCTETQKRAAPVIFASVQRTNAFSKIKQLLLIYAYIEALCNKRKVAGSIPDEVIGFSNLPTSSIPTMTLGSGQPLKETSIRNLSGGKGRPTLMTDNLTFICEPIFYTMWEPRRLTTLWASTVC